MLFRRTIGIEMKVRVTKQGMWSLTEHRWMNQAIDDKLTYCLRNPQYYTRIYQFKEYIKLIKP